MTCVGTRSLMSNSNIAPHNPTVRPDNERRRHGHPVPQQIEHAEILGHLLVCIGQDRELRPCQLLHPLHIDKQVRADRRKTNIPILKLAVETLQLDQLLLADVSTEAAIEGKHERIPAPPKAHPALYRSPVPVGREKSGACGASASGVSGGTAFAVGKGVSIAVGEGARVGAAVDDSSEHPITKNTAAARMAIRRRFVTCSIVMKRRGLCPMHRWSYRVTAKLKSTEYSTDDSSRCQGQAILAI